MNQSIQARNKALVLEAFDTLFNKRDYARAERYWSPNLTTRLRNRAQAGADAGGAARLSQELKKKCWNSLSC
jgi:hypothetical protein